MPQTYQMWPEVTLNRIIQTLIYRLASHPLIQNPPIWNFKGEQIKITKFRNYDGPEIKNASGLTLSVFPYHMNNGGDDTILTAKSVNAAQVFKPYTLGANGTDGTTKDEASANIVLRLHSVGFSQEGDTDNETIENQQTVFEFNFQEFLLRQYMDLLGAVLRGNDMRLLPRFVDNVPLLSDSFVHHTDHPTGNWVRKENSLLHSAALLWEAKYYVTREWRLPPDWVLIDMVDGALPLGYITDPQGVQHNVSYDTIRNLFLFSDGTVVARTMLNNPTNPLNVFATLDADLIALIDQAPSSPLNYSLYYTQVDRNQV